MNKTNPSPTRNAKSFLEWIARDDVAVHELLDWCYFGFGRGRGAEEPHLQLYLALPMGGDAYPKRKRLAARVAAVFTQWPSLSIPYPGYEETPESLLYDLLSLAGRLNCPDILYDSLWQIRITLLKQGKQLSQMASVALTKALIHNQGKYHSEMLAVWKPMVEGKQDSVLVGEPEIGMEGIGMMPGKETDERPDCDAVNFGLEALAKRYASDRRTRRQRFRSQVIWLQNLWALPPEYYILLAHDHQWVQKDLGWAVDALPDLFVSNFGEMEKPDEHCALAWRWFVDCLKPWADVEIEKELCGGRVLQVRFSAQTSDQFDNVRRQLEGVARLKPIISEAEANRYTCQIMERLEQDLRGRNQAAAIKLKAAENDFCQIVNPTFAPSLSK